MPLRVYRETLLPCDADAAWALVQTTALLNRVAFPVLRFTGLNPPELPEMWREGATVTVRLYLLGVIPLGVHTLYIESVDDQARRIQTRERDLLTRRWDHTIHVQESVDGRARYSDTLEIDAGLLTVPVCLFARFLFWHRHKRWRRIALEAAS